MNSTANRRSAQLRSTAAKLLQLANELETEDYGAAAGSRLRPADSSSSWNDLNTQFILSRAVENYRARRRRKMFLDPSLFGEPAWDILLDLFAARLQNRRISVSSACIGADVPPTTALRWLGLLEEAGLVTRHENDSDLRVTWVKLTDEASKAMFEYFEDAIDGSNRVDPGLPEYLVVKQAD